MFIVETSSRKEFSLGEFISLYEAQRFMGFLNFCFALSEWIKHGLFFQRIFFSGENEFIL